MLIKNQKLYYKSFYQNRYEDKFIKPEEAVVYIEFKKVNKTYYIIKNLFLVMLTLYLVNLIIVLAKFILLQHLIIA